MPSDRSPVFRKAIIPWYNSKTVCVLTIAFMLLVFLFGLAGISVAREHEDYNGYIWVPLMLVVMSAGIIVFNIIRLIRQRTSRKSLSL
ncbi:MAG: hypothetical protein P8X90_14805 [Desulfobacterales bacterium]